MTCIRADQELAALSAVGIERRRVGRLPRDLEFSAAHAEFIQQRSHGLGHAPGRAQARLCQRQSLFCVAGNQMLKFLLQLPKPLTGISQLLQFPAHRTGVRFQLRDRHAVLARKFVQHAELAVDISQSLRVQIQRILIASKAGVGFAQLDPRRIYAAGHFGKSRIKFGETRCFRMGTR